MQNLIMKAEYDTWLKKDWSKQASELGERQRVFVPKGKSYNFLKLTEESLESQGDKQAGHSLVELDFKAGKWYVFSTDWQFPWSKEIICPSSNLPKWGDIDWGDFTASVSRYFTAGEVALYQRDRIPSTDEIKINAVRIARKLDEIREWWGSALLVNSWFRPLAIEKAIKGSGQNHPFGHSVDIRPQIGSIWDLQIRFQQEWYNTGKWEGGFGKGAKKGFIHLDLNPKRVWNY